MTRVSDLSCHRAGNTSGEILRLSVSRIFRTFRHKYSLVMVDADKSYSCRAWSHDWVLSLWICVRIIIALHAINRNAEVYCIFGQANNIEKHME